MERPGVFLYFVFQRASGYSDRNQKLTTSIMLELFLHLPLGVINICLLIKKKK